MNILAGLTVKGLSYACIALGIALALSVTGWTLHARSLNATITDLNKDVGAKEGAITSALAGAEKWKALAETETGKVAACHVLLQTEELANDVAVARAQDAQAAAQAEFNAFRAVFQNVTGTCTTALANMQRACADDIPAY
jgi:hypothetical protein